jgi:LuxR family maltose regulon positive regulatory protein
MQPRVKARDAIRLARSQIWTDDVKARAALDAGFEAAVSDRETHLARGAAGLALCTYAMHFADFRGLARWAERWSSLAAVAVDDPVLSLYGAGATLALPTLGFGSYESPDLDTAAARLFTGLQDTADLDDDEHLALAKLWVEYASMRHDRQGIQRLMLMAAAWLDHSQPMARGVWWLMHARNELQFGTPSLADTSVAQAREIAETHGIASLQLALRVQSLRTALQAGDLDESERLLAEIRPLSLRVRPGHHRSALQLEAMDALLRGQAFRAMSLLDLLLQVCEDTEVPLRDRGLYHVYRAYAALELGDLPAALKSIATARAGQSGAQGQMVDCIEQLIVASDALHRRVPEALHLACDAMRTAANLEYQMFLAAQPVRASRLAEAVLDAGVVVDFVRASIRQRRLAPSDPLREEWPWAIKVRALGAFAIERDGQLLIFDGKAQKKPLELLKAVVALGGDAVPREALALALWPDPDADGIKNFDVTLSRLRKLLDVDGAILLTEGKVTLNRRLVWWDVTAFEARFAQLQTALHEDDSEDAIPALAGELFRLHSDKLFGDEAAAAWSVAPRERLAVKFNRAVSDVGAWLEARGRHREAIDRYERGLAQQVLAEPLYRGLMRCHLALDEPAEAARAYRRCRELLSIVLSVAPSAETEALRRQIPSA